MTTKKVCRPSLLQRRGLIMLAALDTKCPGRWPRGILNGGYWSSVGDTSVYVTKLRASCRRIGSPLSAPNLQLVVELTDTDRNHKCVHRIYCLLKLNFRLEG
ncbi:Uncharacterised protein [Raoultella planticola]|uniref:Uncharacterized protein n=1 Tax=Raoultella planticola TaxID=575 RepID=A0A485D364_RAOPL|nr:Uncharacterised protein [Raoultella planticola]